MRRFGEDKNTATTKFNNFVLTGIGLQEEIDFKKGTEDGILGDDNFVQIVQSSAELDPELTLSLEDIVNTVCDFYGINQFYAHCTWEG